MGCCIIIGAGECTGLLQPVEEADCLIAADGGLAHVKNLGLTPDVILGDFDSLGRYISAESNSSPLISIANTTLATFRDRAIIALPDPLVSFL